MKKLTIVILVLLSLSSKLNAQVSAAGNNTVNKEISIYTNPSADVINITASDKNENLSLDLYDSHRTKVFTKTFRGNTEKIAASQLAIGSYTVVIYSNGKMVRTQKIVID